MRVSLSYLSILAYVVPALLVLLLSSLYGYELSDTGRTVIAGSIIATLLGYVVSVAFSGLIRRDDVFVRRGTDMRVSRAMLTFGIVAMVVDMAAVGSIPLLFGGEGRVQLQSSFLWNVYVLGVLGVFLFARNSTIYKSKTLDKNLVRFYFVLAIMTAWKGTFLLVLTAYIAPKFKRAKINFFQLIVAAALTFVLFFGINFLRSDKPPAEVVAQLAYYVIWGFVNFDIEAVGASSECIHSIPIIGCQFSVDNKYLVNSTWNVFTALSPIYIDGGLILVVTLFFVMAVIVGYLGRRSSSVMGDYIYFLALYFFIMAHNGYAFYSASFFVSIVLILAVSFAQSFTRQVRQIAIERPN